VGGITFLHYSTQMDRNLQHAFYRELYFLPIVLAGFWFGLPIVEKIVEAHEGRLEVLDNNKNGVTFRIVLSVGGNRRRTG
jgi:K+-sensing histidine kinase KdpD